MQLSSQQYFGSSVRQVEIGGLTLTLSHYPAGERQPWHIHENPTLFLLLHGDFLDRDLQGDHILDSLMMVFHPTEVSHACEVGPRGMVGLNIEPSFSWLDRYALGPRDLGAYTLLTSPTARLTALRLLMHAFVAQDSASFVIEDEMVEVITPLLERRYALSAASRPRWLDQVEALLHADSESDCSLSTVAREIGIHPVYLARVFRAHYGCSLGDYMRRRRLLCASRYALQAGHTLGQAAHEAGFTDQSHFVRRFDQEIGLSPGVLLKLRAMILSQVSNVQES